MCKYFILFLITLTSCNSFTSNKKVILPNGVNIPLYDNEVQIHEHSKFITEDYFSFFKKNINIQTPLYRTIRHKGYLLFISLPYNKTITNISNENLIKEIYTLEKKESDQTSYSYKSYTQSSQHLVEFVKKIDNNLIYMLAVTSDENTAKSFSKSSYFSDRILIE